MKKCIEEGEAVAWLSDNEIFTIPVVGCTEQEPNARDGMSHTKNIGCGSRRLDESLEWNEERGSSM